MSYFSRLTDIVTCNLSEILASESDPKNAIERIIGEMSEGLKGAKRSVTTAESSLERIEREIAEQKSQADYWAGQAQDELARDNEAQARLALHRKQEVIDVIAGLQQQQQAAVATRDHLATTLRALEARLAEAKRKQGVLETAATSGEALPAGGIDAEASSASVVDDERRKKIDEELQALKRAMGKG